MLIWRASTRESAIDAVAAGTRGGFMAYGLNVAGAGHGAVALRIAWPWGMMRGQPGLAVLAAIPQGGVEPSRSHHDPSEDVDPQQHG